VCRCSRACDEAGARARRSDTRAGAGARGCRATDDRTWWVQAWTTASPEFEGEQGEQWFVTWDGESWTLVDYGTGLGTEDFPAVSEWEELQQ